MQKKKKTKSKKTKVKKVKKGLFHKIGKGSVSTVYQIDIENIKPITRPLVNQELKEDMLENGMSDPLVLKAKDMKCLLGNQRLAILKELGVKKVPVVIRGKVHLRKLKKQLTRWKGI